MKREDLLNLARRHWEAMADFRAERARCKRYTYGRQWEDYINVDGTRIRESEYIRAQGNIPLKNNLIRRIVRNVLGVFRDRTALPTAADLDLEPTAENEELMRLLSLNYRRNNLEELNARTMEEFLISGLAVNRKWRGMRNGVYGVWTDYVQPDYFFIDADMRDFRGWDAAVVGEIHDVDFAELCSRLAAGPDDMERLRTAYAEAADPESLAVAAGAFGAQPEIPAFLTPSAPGRCRVIELWRKETRERYRCHDRMTGELFRIEAADRKRLVDNINARRRAEGRRLGLPPEQVRLIDCRWTLDEVWRYFFLSPLGEVLAEGDSTCPDGCHPYIFKAYPFIDGEIHSFVSDLIDQQRYVNRLVTLYDWVMRASAKGVLMFPESAIPDGMDINEIAAEWSRFNGLIIYKPKAGVPVPQQVSANTSNVGITELLQVQLKMIEDVSGVNSALQGKLDSGAISGTLYDQQTRHALTGLLDILQTYTTFLRDGARREIHLLSISN